jgi:putative tryptophan/tyrosine transport system substrate-binding protein
MRRREFITLLGGAAVAWPFAARAQQGERMRRIGIVTVFSESDPEGQSRLRVLVQRLGELGWTEGRNLHIDYRWGAAERGRVRALAQELIALQPDMIVAGGGPAAFATWQATRSVPVVFVQVVDPVALGIVASLARPGGNLTGFTHFESAIVGKWLEALKEIAPGMSRAAVVFDSDNPASAVYLRAIETVLPSFGVQLTPTGVRDAAEIERAIDFLAPERNGGLIVLPGPATNAHRELIIALAARHRLPAVYPQRYFVQDGGLMSYGVDLPDMYRRTASYVDRILKGEKPADLPVQSPTKYELVINLKTAKALGIDVPLFLQQRADELIE